MSKTMVILVAVLAFATGIRTEGYVTPAALSQAPRVARQGQEGDQEAGAAAFRAITFAQHRTPDR